MATESAKPLIKGAFVIPILVITVGVGWLLTDQKIGPGIDWVWTLGLGVVGILTFFVCGGIDKVSVVVGPFFMGASCLSILRQQGQIKVDTEVPILVILVGVLMFLAMLPSVRNPRWSLFPEMNEGQTK